VAEVSFQDVLLSLCQSLIGAISDNFRMVTIEDLKDGWEVVFYLKHENDEDREEIEDLLGDFAGHLGMTSKFLRSIVVITDEFLMTPGPSGPVAVFKRRQ
jgi:hypothetical protein